MITMARESVSFVVYGPPRPKERPRVLPGGGAYTPRRTREYEAAIAAVGSLHCGSWRRDGSFAVRAVFVFETRHRRDIDNCLKAVLDGLNGIAWRDDSQVVEATCSKRWEPEGLERTEVTIERIAGGKP